MVDVIFANPLWGLRINLCGYEKVSGKLLVVRSKITQKYRRLSTAWFHASGIALFVVYQTVLAASLATFLSHGHGHTFPGTQTYQVTLKPSEGGKHVKEHFPLLAW